jgi:bifunctional non-homologous end joining protein LigD
VKLIRPMLASLSTEIPSGPEWVFEEKYDGIRALAYRTKKTVRLWSRNGLDLTGGFPDIAAAVVALPGGDLVLDGELVVFDPKGVSRFQLLQRRGAGGRTEYAVFDLLERDGVSLL